MIGIIVKAIAVILMSTAIVGTNVGYIDYIDCGACGSHVSEWGYVADSDGNLVEVCLDCYRIFDDEGRRDGQG